MKKFTVLQFVSELEMALREGIVCLFDINDNQEPRYQYVSLNESYVDFGKNNIPVSSIEIDGLTYNELMVFDVLNKEFVKLIPTLFCGLVYQIAKFDDATKEQADAILCLDKNDFVTADGSKAILSGVNDHHTYNILFSYQNGDKVNTVAVNQFGRDQYRKRTIFNADINNKMKNGYVLLSPIQEPVWLDQNTMTAVDITAANDNALLLPASAQLFNGNITEITIPVKQSN